MGLFLHTGNRLERLADGLFEHWRREPPSPLEPRVLVVESASLARWIQVRLCRREGVAMLVETPLPARWLWRTASTLLGLDADDDPLSREAMQWRILQYLEDGSPVLRGPEAAELRHYLRRGGGKQSSGQGAGELRRWQLAGRIADVFDRYQYYRPELIRAWSRRDFSTGGWQGPLWHELAAAVPWHRVALLDRFREALPTGGTARGIPARIDLFSLHALPPLVLEAFAALSQCAGVHVWLLSPTDQYWADLQSPREMARRRIAEPGTAELWQQGHPLLTRWGRLGQTFQDRLLETAGDLVSETERYDPPAGDSLLARLQSELFAAGAPEARVVAVGDDPQHPSIQLHSCHSAMRECQVLHDTLLHCLRQDPGLQPEDILVMVPEISRYAPFIEAMFGAGSEQAPRLPFNLSDVLVADEHPLIRAFLSLLELPGARFTRAEVLALLHLPEVQQRHGLQEDDVGALVELLDRLHVYWGLDGADKRARFDLPAIPDNTWHQAFQRVMAGFALGDDALYGDIAPHPRAGTRVAARAARLFGLLDILREAARELARPASARDWGDRLGRLVHAVLGEDADESGRLDRIHEALSELDRLGGLHPGAIDLAVVRDWLTRRLSVHSERGRFYSGGITFCALQPLRGVPFRVICVLGLQDQAFPRRHTPLDFDLMGREPRHGDPHPAHEDRYLFLETVLAARERLILFWTGRDPRRNEPLQPSVVVEELREHLDTRFVLAGKKAGEAVFREHPLQPFAARNYRSPLPGFDRWWHQAAAALVAHHPPEPPGGWPVLDLPPPDDQDRTLSPTELGSFLRDPARQFVRRRLRIPAPDDAPLVEEEPVQADGLGDWQIRDRWLNAWLEGADEEAVARRLRAEGRLLHGALGRHQLEAVDPVSTLTGQLPFRRPLRPQPADCHRPVVTPDGEEWILQGRLPAHHLDTTGQRLLVRASGSGFRFADLLPLWVEHLCLHAGGDRARTWYLCRDGIHGIGPVEADRARQLLGELVGHYVRGRRTPLPFLRESSSAWMAEFRTDKGKAEKDAPEGRARRALQQARSRWHGYRHHRGEREQPHCQVLLRGRRWEPDQALADITAALLGPLAEHLVTP